VAPGLKRVLFFQPDLVGGGAERSVLNLINNLDRARFAPSLVLAKADGPLVGMLRDDVPLTVLGSRRMRTALLGLVREIKRQRPDILFSTMQGPSFMLWLARAIARSRARLVLRESNNWTARGVPPTTPSQRLVGLAYRRADAVVCLSEGVNLDTKRRYGNVRTVTIHNPVDVAGIQRRAQDLSGPVPDWPSERERPEVQLLAVGRLTRQKGFDLLIEAVASLRDLPWRLTILGEGPDHAALLDQARLAGLQDRIDFPGYAPNPYPWFAAADVFVLSSRWEGFGHVIVEAMVNGAAVLATRCPSGPDEIVTDGVDGLLCDVSVEGLVGGLRSLIVDSDLRARLSQAAVATPARFDVPTIVGQYQTLFDRLLGQP